MKSVLINEAYCPKNHPCPILRICPSGAITQKSIYSAPEIDQSKCTSCGKCTKYCGYGAFQLMQ